MKKAYIYLISFDGTYDIYIGVTTTNINKRFKSHKADKWCVVCQYVLHNLDYDWSKVHIDIIDTIDVDEDLTHLLDHPLNTVDKTLPRFKKYTYNKTSQHKLANLKLQYTELFPYTSLQHRRKV